MTIPLDLLQIAYLSILWIIHRHQNGQTGADVLAAVWLSSVGLQMANEGYPNLPAWIICDFFAAIALHLLINNPIKWRIIAPIPFMIAINAISYSVSAEIPKWHKPLIDTFCWLQLLLFAEGLLHGKLVEALDSIAGSTPLLNRLATFKRRK